MNDETNLQNVLESTIRISVQTVQNDKRLYCILMA